MASQSGKRKRRRLAPGVQDIVIDLIQAPDRTYTAVEIIDKLEKLDAARYARLGVHRFAKIPRVRTVQRMIQEFGPGISDEAWKAEDEEDPADARTILDVWGSAIAYRIESGDERPDGHYWGKRLAECILYAAKIAPGLKPYATYLLARLLLIQELGGSDPKPLDVLLAMAPWRNVQAYVYYCNAVEAGKMPPVLQGARLLLEIGRDTYAEAYPPAVSIEQPDLAADFGRHLTDQYNNADYLLSDEQQLEQTVGQPETERSE